MIDAHGSSVTLSGHRLKRLREARGASQEDVAGVLGCSVEELYRIEKSFVQCSCEKISAVKEFFGIDGMPLLDEEADTFRERLYLWRDYIKNRQLNEAAELQEIISPITDFPLEPNLSMLYNMFEVILLMVEGKLDIAEERLKAHGKYLVDMEDADIENSFHYYRNIGSLRLFQGRREEALESYLKALAFGETKDELLKDDGALFYNIASCYSNLHLPHHAIAFLQKIKWFEDDRTKKFKLQLDNIMAVNYLRLNMTKEAKDLLDSCMARAKAAHDKASIAIVLHNFGVLNWTSESWEEAINYFDKVFSYCREWDGLYLETLYHKLMCLIRMSEHRSVELLIEQAKDSYEGDAKYSLLFESLNCVMILNRETTVHASKAADYLETVAIPRLTEIYEYSKAIDLYKILCEHHQKAGNLNWPMKISEVIMNVYIKMLYGGGRK